MKSYDNWKPSKYIKYENKNNLYGWFEWLNKKEIDKVDVNSIGENNSDRCILEVHLQHLDKLHELLDDYPLASEKL